ncbi:MAG: IS1 family transposase [Terriglobia bacterium]|jgi:IS1 family transposase/transposase-like protein
MTCHNCKTQCKKFGKDRKGNQRFRCCQCYKTYSERPDKLDGTYLLTEKVAQIIRLFVEGCSVRSIERITETHRDTILNVLVLAGERCERLLENTICNIPVRDVQCDEIWGYVGCKEKRNVNGDPLRGDAYCFVAIERNTKLVLTWHLGRRTARDAQEFIEKLNGVTAGRFQVTTDGFPPYFDAVHTSLGTRVDYSQLIKLYGSGNEDEHRYSPPRVIDAIAKPMWGNPDPERICTSHVERQNLTLRMHMRRLTRLTNAFSKKWYNLKCAFALWFAYYNFCRIHQTLRVTPVMEAGLADHVWSIEGLVALLGA